MIGDTQAALPARTRIFFGESDVRRPVVRWHGEMCEERPDTLAPEEPLEIRLAGRSLTVTMRTPGHDEELAAGLLYAQELVHCAADLGAMTRDPAQPNLLDVRLSEAVDGAERWRRYTYASSTCGLRGGESLEALVLDHPPVTAQLRVRARTLYRLDAHLRAAQAGFGASGGTHAAALFDSAGDLVVVREDVGRHNAVDKVVGYALLRDGLPL